MCCLQRQSLKSYGELFQLCRKRSVYFKHVKRLTGSLPYIPFKETFFNSKSLHFQTLRNFKSAQVNVMPIIKVGKENESIELRQPEMELQAMSFKISLILIS